MLQGEIIFNKRSVDGLKVYPEVVVQNLIVKNGLNGIHSGFIINNFRIGSSTDPSNVNHTDVVTRIGEPNYPILSINAISNPDDPVINNGSFWILEVKAELPAGVALTGINEISFGKLFNSEWTAFNRARIKNRNGIETTLEKEADEIIDITYRLRVSTPSAAIQIGNITVGSQTSNLSIKGIYRATNRLVNNTHGLNNLIEGIKISSDNRVRDYLESTDDFIAIDESKIAKKNYVIDSYEDNVDIKFVTDLTTSLVIGNIVIEHKFGDVQYILDPPITVDPRHIATLSLNYKWA